MPLGARLPLRIIALFIASAHLPQLQGPSLAAERDAPASLPAPPAPNSDARPQALTDRPDGAADALAADADALPPFRRGLLVLPFVGLQIPLDAASWISTGYRFGSLLGGHLSENISLGAELAFATWTWDTPAYDGWDIPGVTLTHRAGQVDVGAVLLRHAGLSWGEVIFGPRLGGAMIFRRDLEGSLRTFVNGWQAGMKLGVLMALSRSLALGAAVDFSYVLNPIETEANCFAYETGSTPDSPRCPDTRNTFLGSLTAAMLF
jgi:hypothetical protein